MDDFQADGETGFVIDEVSKIIKELPQPYPELIILSRCVQSISSWKIPSEMMVEWEKTMSLGIFQLLKTADPVTCIIMQKNGAGLQTASTCFWDNSTDESCAVRWENKSMYCIVSVFGLSI